MIKTLLLFIVLAIGAGCPSAPMFTASVPEPDVPLAITRRDTKSKALEMSRRADELCAAIEQHSGRQKFYLTERASTRQTIGLLITTVVGVAGGIVTTIVAANQDADANGNVSTTASTIAGASASGATAIAGVVSALVAGSGAKDELAIIDTELDGIKQRTDDRDRACQAPAPQNGSVPTTNWDECFSSARKLYIACRTTACSLRYRIPGWDNKSCSKVPSFTSTDDK